MMSDVNDYNESVLVVQPDKSILLYKSCTLIKLSLTGGAGNM